jgi:hypothetical protein
MSDSINTVKTILSGQIGDGRTRLSCVVNSNNAKAKNVIFLFYVDSQPLAIGQKVRVGYYNQEIECAVRHTNYDKSREIAFQALELLGVNRRNINVSLFLEDSSPNYKGIDNTSGHVWSFNFKIRGKQ